jgi:hypothetical protein
MTDIAVDDPTLGQLGTDIRVFGKWSGAEVQISDMSLEVCSEFQLKFDKENLFRIIFSVPNSLNFFHIQLVVIK